jgi:GTP-binding protein
MNLNNLALLVSAVRATQYPQTILCETAFVGRSNVGKSTLINKLLNRKSFARVSGTPGKTATINFYAVDDALIFVDLPGYGYAKVSRKEKEKWGLMIEEYLYTRHQLTHIYQLLDARRVPTDDDAAMLDWIKRSNKSFAVVCTKMDKLKKSEREGNLQKIRETLRLKASDVLIPFSGETGEGRDALWDDILSHSMKL